MKLTTLIIAGLIISVGTVYGQKGVEDGSKYGHGEDSIRCRTNNSLYYENYKNKNYTAAFPQWEIVFNECPLSRSSIYSQGANIIKNLMAKESDDQKKEDYYQLLMKVYDQRIKYFGNSKKYPTPYIQGRKGVDILTFKKDDVAAMEEANKLFLASIAGRGNKTEDGVLFMHMNNSVSLYKADKATAEDVVNAFTSISDILEAKIKATPEDKEVAELSENIEKIFANSGTADCATIDAVFGPKFDKNSDNIDWLKRVNRILYQQLCETDFVFTVAAQLHKLEPSSSSARSMAAKCLRSKDYEGATNYYIEAIQLETDDEERGSYNYELGLVYISQSKYQDAKVFLRRAMELKPNWGLPYMQLGLIYGLSAATCGDNDFEHKCAYWAAVDQFEKAKRIDATVSDEANKNIKTFSAYFPKQDELFFYKMKEGDSYKVGCWINESTKVRAKK